jgi:hypothetical protein
MGSKTDFEIHAVKRCATAAISFKCDDRNIARLLCLDLHKEGYMVTHIRTATGMHIGKHDVEAAMRSELMRSPGKKG